MLLSRFLKSSATGASGVVPFMPFRSPGWSLKAAPKLLIMLPSEPYSRTAALARSGFAGSLSRPNEPQPAASSENTASDAISEYGVVRAPRVGRPDRCVRAAAGRSVACSVIADLPWRPLLTVRTIAGRFDHPAR